MALRLPVPCLVVLVGPGASGKSTWAATHFPASQIVSSDALRAVVGEGEHDQRAGKDAFDVLDLVVERRLRRRLTTVVDTLGLDAKRRRRWRELADRHGVPAVIVGFDTDPSRCRDRNRSRERSIPPAVLSSQLTTWGAVRDVLLADERWSAVHVLDEVGVGEPVHLVAPDLVAAPAAAARHQEAPMPLRFGLQIPSFTWPGGPPEIGPRLRDIARAAEDAGFESVWVMDHFLQIPQVGREWMDMLDSYTTLGHLAAVTERVRLGTMVTGITYRNVAHLGKIIATLDVLSGGRAVCGIGAAWFEREHRAYGWDFPSAGKRLDILEDALQVLPLLWGKGTPPFEGRTMSLPDTTCYPRPLQERVPILVGGGGERRTLRLVARYADACNITGDLQNLRHKLDVLRGHCAEVGRDPAEIEVTHLSTALVGSDEAAVADAVERRRPERMDAATFAARVNAATVSDHVGRFRQLAEAGVQTAIVNLPDLGDTEPVERFAEIVAAFT